MKKFLLPKKKFLGDFFFWKLRCLSLIEKAPTCIRRLQRDAFPENMESFGFFEFALVQAVWSRLLLDSGLLRDRAPPPHCKNCPYIYKPIIWSCIFHVNPVLLGAQARGTVVLCYCVMVHGLGIRLCRLFHTFWVRRSAGDGCPPSLTSGTSPRSRSASLG